MPTADSAAAVAVHDTGAGADLGPDGKADGAASQQAEPVCKPVANCNDGNKCTVDFCRTDGTCDHAPVYCGNGNPCTVDGCDPETGCTFKPADCDDADICTNDNCEAGIGCTWKPQGCDDGNPCTADTCANNKCSSVPKTNGLLCLSQGGECQAGVCAKPACAGTGWKGWMTQLPENANWGDALAVAFANETVAVAFGGFTTKQYPARVQWFSAAGEPGPQTALAPPSGQITAAIALVDGSVAVAGSLTSSGGESSGFVGRVTAEGEVSLNSPAGWSWGQRLASNTNAVWVASRHGPWASSLATVAVARLDGMAKPMSQTLLPKLLPSNSMSLVALAVAQDGGAWVLESEYEAAKATNHHRLHRLDANAAPMWVADLGKDATTNPIGMVPRAAGNILVVERTFNGNSGAVGARVRVVSAAGTPGAWTALPLAVYPQSVILGSNGSYWLRGIENAPSAGPGQQQPWLASLDSNDNLQFKVSISTTEVLTGHALTVTPNGRLLGVWGAGVAPEGKFTPPKSTWLATTDPWGHLTCTAAGKCAGLTSCTDGDPCTADACSPNSGCTFTPLPAGATCTQN